MKKVLIPALMILILCACTFRGCQAEKSELELTFTNWTSPTSPPGRATAKWVEMVETRTDGQVKVKALYSATLLTGKNTIEGILRGVADVGMNVSSFRPERFPMLALLNYPHPYKHTMVPIRIAWDMYNTFDPPEFKGVKVISFSNNGLGENGCGFYGKFPVTIMADLKGKEIRATGTGVPALEKLGASPVFLPVSEIYEALQKNIIKGIYASFEIIQPFKFNEVIDYITPFPAPGALMFTIVNEERFHSWPEQVRKVIEDIKMEHSEWAGNFAHEASQGGLSFALQNGVKMTTLSLEEREKMMRILEPMRDEWLKETQAKGLPAQAWLDEFDRLLEKYNAQY
ncbi:MAG: TRAP transporter substrate-binding protein DctP [Deltaproteobacteria bacterium]|nr:TRAP transporter substrate-binding protein DctP [Deltaproteobacteria bacterium]